MNILITICARAGSKGIPGKNTKLLNGKPLIAYSLETAKKFAKLYNAHLAISTDDDTVKKICTSFGINTTYTRPEILATDSAGKVDTIFDLLLHEEKNGKLKFDYILDLDVTSPLRNLHDLTEAFNMILTDTEALNIFSVSKAIKNPYFNMVEKKESGYYHLVKLGNFLTRQSATPVYEMNASFYFYKRSFFEQVQKSVVNNRSLIYLVPHTCFDLDHPIDFEFMEFMLVNNKLDFTL